MTDDGPIVQRWRIAQGPEASRAALRRAAHEMIRGSGLSDFNMRALAASVGLSTMAAYRYYASKEELVEDIREEIRRDFASALETAAAKVSSPAAGKLRAMCGAYLEYAVRKGSDYDLMFGSAPPPDAPPIVDPLRAPAWHILVGCLRDLDPDASFKVLLERAHFVWSTLHGLVMLHLSRRLRFGMSLDDLLEPSVERLCAALGVK